MFLLRSAMIALVRLVLLGLVVCASASAQRAPQVLLGAGASPIGGATSPVGAVTVIGWPMMAGVAVHAEVGRRYFWSEVPSAAAVGVLAALAVPAGTGEVVLMAGPSLSRDTERFESEAARWRLGAMGRVQATLPATGPVGLTVGAGVTASPDVVRPSLVSGVTVRFGR